MRRIALVLALALAGVAATAQADTFVVVQSDAPATTSAVVPNTPGTIGLPLELSAPPAQPQQLSAPELMNLWQQAGSAYGIPWQVLAAINKVESNFGRNMGPSSAGAIGWMQFMPSTWLRWGTDGNGDGVADPWNAQDAIVSAARYLAAAGGQTDIRSAVFSYNHADWYVNEVLALAQTFSGGSPFQLDGMQQQLDAAQTAVTAANEALIGAQADRQAAAGVEDRWLARVATAKLLSDRLDAQKQATLAGVRLDGVVARITDLQARLAAAQTDLDRARSDSQAAAFDQGAGALLGAPVTQGRYVFPVGGGPGEVSVSHLHHDYPAADIAAPEGSPAYALADGIVVRAWAAPDPACGIGFTMQTFDGLVWTYCHFAYLEPTVREGVQLQAGDPVGLVGHTGDATGPHLHLQLQPATSYPQEQPWFQSFAGIAFAWQDGAPAAGTDGRTLAAFAAPPAAAAGPNAVFSVVPTPQASGDVVGFTIGG